MPAPMLKRKQQLLRLLHQLLPLLLLLHLLPPQLLQHQQHQHLLKPLLQRLPLLPQLLSRSEDNNEGNNKKCSSVI